MVRHTPEFNLFEPDLCMIAGYYTLASASILLSDLPETLAKKLPRYPSVPAVRMGRLAVSDSFKGKGLGAALLADALRIVAHVLASKVK